MPAFWAALLGAVLGTLLVLVALIWWRHRTLMRTPGTFRARLRRPGAPGPGRPVIGRYNEVGLDLLALLSVDPRPVWSTARYQAQLRRVEQDSCHQDAVVVHLQGAEDTVEMVLSSAETAGLSAWIESGPTVGYGAYRQHARRKPFAGW